MPEDGIAILAPLILLCDSEAISFHRQRVAPTVEAQGKVRSLTTNDVLSVLESFHDKENLRLNLLYDLESEDFVDELAHVLSGHWLKGMTLYHHNSTINPLFSIDAPTVFFLLCSPRNILQILGKETPKGLKNDYVTWLLILNTKEAQEVMMTLERTLQEGTHIVLVAKGFLGSMDVFYTRAESRRVISFEKRHKLNPRTKTGQRRDLNSRRDEYLGQYSDMEGRKLTVAANDNFGFCALGGADPDGSVRPLSGVDLELVNTLGRTLNFTYRVMRPADGQWGNPLPNGTITGMIGMVARREADFAVCFISVTRDRVAVVDFTYSYYRSVIAIFSRAPRQRNRALAILSPFSPQVWICITLSVLTMGVVVSIQLKISDFLLKENSRWTLQWNTFNLFRSLVAQGNDMPAKHGWTKVILVFWSVSCLTFSASYSGMLTAVLAQPLFESPIESLLDLPKAVKEGFTLGVKAGTNIEFLFKEASDGILKTTWDLFDHGDRGRSFVNDNVTGMKKVLESDFLLIGMKVVCELLSMKLGRSKFHIGRDDFFPHSIAVPVPIGAPYKEVFDRVMMRMVEGGLISKWKEEEVRKVSQRTPDSVASSRAYAITLKHLQAAFFIMIVGFVLATVVLVVERAVYDSHPWRIFQLIK
ncbi:glutamate receptor ionotropic, delta-2-like [Palaemon carinicauda]|uniref:glutamate receptor ionotropic, delta-2-like n=1 Tax=Palaemon carinicauda TaxID=392227 RepID=UPI0035B583A3